MDVVVMQDELIVADREVRLRTGPHSEEHACEIILDKADEEEALLAVEPGKFTLEIEIDPIEAVAANSIIQCVDAGQRLELGGETVVGAGCRFDERVAEKR